MQKGTTRAILIVVGVLICLAVLGIGLSALFFMRATEFTTSDKRDTDKLWEQVRGRFNHARPILEITDAEETIITRRPPATAPARVGSLHLAAWDPDDQNLMRVTLPFWLLRLKAGPIEVSSRRGISGRKRHLDLTIEELERYGPALLMDHTGRGGDRVLIWTE